MIESIFIEELCEDLRLEPGLENIKEEEVDKKLIDLMSLVHIFPLSECVSSYIQWKERFNELEKALSPLTVLMVTPNEEEGLFSKHLYVNLALASNLMEGAISLALMNKAEGSGILMRSALELWLDGMLLEHLRSPKFRRKVDENWSRRDSVTKFLKTLRGESNRLGVNIEKTIWLYCEQRTYLRKGDVVYWLEQWGCFEPITEASRSIKHIWEWLSKEVHGQLIPLVSRIDRLKFLRETIGLIDLFLVGVINTLRNLASEKLYEVDNDSWEKFVRSVNESGLSFAKEAIKKLRR